MKYCSIVFLLCLTCVFLSCRRIKSYINTEKEIKAHYDTLSFKPNYVKIKTDSSQLFLATFGNPKAQPIIFIHGAPGRWDGFWKQLDDTTLHDDFFLIGLDRPGYGKSYFKRKGKALSIQKQAEIIEQSLSILNLNQKPILVTRSYGAPVGAMMVIRKPERYQHLALMSPAIDPEAEKFFWFSNLGRLWVVKVFLPRRLNTATNEKFAHKKDLKAIDSIWNEIQTPTTVYFGGKDWVITEANFDFAKKKLGEKATYIYLPDAGHRISRQYPELLKKLFYENRNTIDNR